MKTRYIIVLILILLGVGLWAYKAFASSSGPNGPSTTIATTISGGSVSWVNPNNAQVSDGVYTVASGGSSDSSRALVATNFGFAIPTGATINGVLVEVQSLGSNGFAGTINLYSSGAPIGTGKTMTWPGSEAYVSYGSSVDTWSASPTYSMINNSGFGVSVDGTSGDVAGAWSTSIDYVRITVYYTSAAGTHSSVTLKSGKWVIKNSTVIIN